MILRYFVDTKFIWLPFDSRNDMCNIVNEGTTSFTKNHRYRNLVRIIQIIYIIIHLSYAWKISLSNMEYFIRKGFFSFSTFNVECCILLKIFYYFLYRIEQIIKQKWCITDLPVSYFLAAWSIVCPNIQALHTSFPRS